MFSTLPRYIQEKAAQAENFVATGLTLSEKNGNGGHHYGDTLPENYPGVPGFAEFQDDDEELPF